MFIIHLSVEELVFSSRFCATNLPPDLFCTPTKTNISTVPSKLSLGSALYTNSLHFIIRISYPEYPSRTEALVEYP
jgi:hypothetical protein